MRRLGRALGSAAWATLVLAVTPGLAHADGDIAPFEAVRALQRLQDRVAAGDATAQAAHDKAMRRTAQTFAAAKLSTWNDKRNARALIVYLFSGGGAAAVEKAIPRSALASDYEALYAGALAYGLGEDGRARSILMPIDARALPSGLGGHLALIQATLAAPADRAAAITLLDLARLLEPGTLVEEAALRKEMSLIGATGDLDKFSLLERRYVSGFARSIYAENFRQLVAQTALQLGAGDNGVAVSRLAKLLGGIDRTEERRLYLVIAREAVIAGHFVMAAAASEAAGRLADHADAEQARAMLYFGAAVVAGPRYEIGLTALANAPPEKLDLADQALRASALSVAALIRKPIGPGGDAARAEGRDAVVADAERALASSQTLVTGVER